MLSRAHTYLTTAQSRSRTVPAPRRPHPTPTARHRTTFLHKWKCSVTSGTGVLTHNALGTHPSCGPQCAPPHCEGGAVRTAESLARPPRLLASAWLSTSTFRRPARPAAALVGCWVKPGGGHLRCAPRPPGTREEGTPRGLQDTGSWGKSCLPDGLGWRRAPQKAHDPPEGCRKNQQSTGRVTEPILGDTAPRAEAKVPSHSGPGQATEPFPLEFLLM